MFCVRGGDLNPNKFPWEVSQFVRIAPQILTNPAQTSGELSGLETKSPPLSKKPPKVTLPLATVYHTVLPTFRPPLAQPSLRFDQIQESSKILYNNQRSYYETITIQHFRRMSIKSKI